jgi:hypothetical protein
MLLGESNGVGLKTFVDIRPVHTGEHSIAPGIRLYREIVLTDNTSVYTHMRMQFHHLGRLKKGYKYDDTDVGFHNGSHNYQTEY